MRIGRPLKNPSNPIARLRETLSDEDHQFTRTELAQKTGVPEATLRDIELGKFKLTVGIAMRISLGCGVHPRALMRDEKPLLDCGGNLLTKKSRAVMWVLVDYSHQQWMGHTCELLGITTNHLHKYLSK